MYKLMLWCWKSDPEERPSFLQVLAEIEKMFVPSVKIEKTLLIQEQQEQIYITCFSHITENVFIYNTDKISKEMANTSEARNTEDSLSTSLKVAVCSVRSMATVD